ncbi:MAG TPA: inositol monophosphatase family protein [Planctomycetota bacterium]|nr:inositol monophosphatase family protein [Planctomycetota bacterium]
MRELEFAKRIAVKAGEMLKRNASGRRSIRYKEGSGNLVTDMDHASEEMIVSALRREFPGHAVVAEESGAAGRSPHRWYIDPVDGTTNYAHGFPLWTVTLAYEREGRLEAGVTYAPVLGELFWARRGGGAFRNGRRIRVTSCGRLEKALLCTGFSYALEWRKVNLRYFAEFLMEAQAIRRMGAASLDLCWTAAGAFDGFWEMRLGPWDMAAGIVILEEAGAKVTNLQGGPVDLSQGDFLGANARLHPQMLAVLNRVRVK